MGTLPGLLQTLPLPLAQLLRRSFNGKSVVERHNNAYYAAEAALKLAAAARIGVWLDRCLEPRSPLARQLEALALPSVGHWAGFLRDVDRVLAGRPDGATLPLGDVVGRLDRRCEHWTAVRALAEAAAEAGVVTDQVRAGALREGFVGFFSLVVAYRNEVMGHGAQRRTAHYEQFGELFLEAIEEVFTGPELFGGLRLAQARLRVADDSASSDVTWQDLSGLAGMPLAESGRAPGAAFDARRVTAGRLYLVGPGTAIPLHPLAVYREDEFGNEFVGFLNKTVRRTKRQAESPVEEVRRADYLDYATGEILPQESALEALTELLGRLRGGQATAEDLHAAAPADASGGAEPGPEPVAARATIGDFELLGELGRGGMGIVYRARQLSVNRIVALKVLPPTLAADRVVLERFRREIAVLARCDHPNVVRILTSGVDGDRSYYAMEFVDGADLGRVSRVLTRWKTSGVALHDGHIPAAISSAGAPATAKGTGEGDVPPEGSGEVPRLEGGRDYFTSLAELFADAARGLDHIHEQGVVHRDVKPGNLMLTADARRIVVMDLGLAKVADASRSLTRAGDGFLGTLRYAPPEQLRRREAKVDRRADVYGLGASLYELATGQPIFDGETEERILKQVLDDEPVPPRRVERSVPGDLATIITVAVAKSPDARYRTAAAMADDLRAFAEHRPIAARPPGPIHRLGLFARRRPALVAALTTAVVFLAVGSGIWWLWSGGPRDEQRTVLCAVHAPVWGVPVCVGEVSGASAARRAVTFRMELRNGRLLRMARVNGSGQPAPDFELREAVSSEFRYRTDGTLQEIVHRDRTGRVVQRDLFSEDLLRQSIVDENHNPLALEGSEVSVLLWTYDAVGHAVECRHANTFGSPRPDPQRMFGYRATVDKRGLPTAWDVVGPEGTPQATPTGIARITREYDERGNLAAISYFGSDGKPVIGPEGWAVRRISHDADGNPIEEAFFDGDGEAVPAARGFARVAWTFDERGNAVEERYFGTDGKPTLGGDGYARLAAEYDGRGNRTGEALFGTDDRPVLGYGGYARRTTAYDERGYRIEDRYFGVDGKPTLHRNGCARLAARFDEHGNRVEESYFDEADQPTIIVEGCARRTAEFDGRGNETEIAYFGTDGKANPSLDGCARRTYRYDERGRQVETVCRDADGEPTFRHEGYSSERRTYDERGNLVETAYFDVAGAATLSTEGIAGVRKRYDEAGNEIETAWLGIDGGRTVAKEGCAAVRRKFDGRGLVTEETCLGADDRPTPGVKGYAIRRAQYDERGNQSEETYFDAEAQPAPHAEGYAGWRAVRDERGRVVELSYLGADERPAADRNGVARWTHVFDARGNETETAFFGEDGAPVLAADGCARWLQQYDGRGLPTEERCFGTDGELVISSKWGYAYARKRYDERGRKVEVSLFGPDDQPIPNEKGEARWVNRYDARGNLAEQVFFGPDGRPTLGRHGCAIRRFTVDDRGRTVRDECLDAEGRPVFCTHGQSRSEIRHDERGFEVEASFFGPDGAPAESTESRARRTRRYDARGNVVEEAYFGKDGRPMAGKFGFARREMRYDERGRRVSERFFGTDDQPVLDTDGVAGWNLVYDAAGREIEAAAVGVDGGVAAGNDGVARSRRAYDAQGKELERACFGTDDQPVLSSVGYSRLLRRYDVRGNLIEESYAGVDGRPVALGDGFASLRQEFDRQSRRVGQAYFGVDGAPVLRKGGYAAARWTYDRRGKVVETLRLGLDGKPIVGSDGYARWTDDYDERGNCVRESYFGADGKPVLLDNGTAGWTKKLDDMGREVELAYFGADGQPVLCKEGWATRRATYDAMSNPIEWTYLGLDGRPVMTTSGYARVEQRYDQRGRLVEEAYFGVDGRPVLRDWGFATARFRYDDLGRRTEQAQFGVDGLPLLGRYGFSIVRYRHDARGNEIESARFGVAGEAVADVSGAHRNRSAYDERGNRVSVRRYDTAGESVGAAQYPDDPVAEEGPDGPVVIPDGTAGWIITYGPPAWARVRIVGWNAAGEPFWGAVKGLAWHRESGGLTIEVDGAPVEDPVARAAAERRIASHEASNRMEQLREERPDLFHGARGQLVVDIPADSAGARLSLQPGDILLVWAGHPLDWLNHLALAAGRAPQGPEQLVLLRDGENRTLDVPPGDLGVRLEAQ